MGNGYPDPEEGGEIDYDAFQNELDNIEDKEEEGNEDGEEKMPGYSVGA